MWNLAVLLALLVASAGGAPQSLEELYPEEHAIYPVDAQMLSAPESLEVREGANISLPCQWEGEHSGDIIPILWKKQPGIILFTGSLVITTDRRIRLGPNNELTISNVTADDDGTYICTVAMKPDPIELQHTVSVQYPATLHPLDSNHFQVREGEPFELNCGADGNPEPVITWSKLPSEDAEGPYIDNGDVVATTNVPEGDDMSFLPESPSKRVSLRLDSVEPHHTGTYTCTAQNEIGAPAVLTATLEVLHAPHIALEPDVVRTAHGLNATIDCKVFANPRAEVVWQWNGRDLPVNSRYEMIVTSRLFSLRIMDVKDEDFGNYTCLAKNELGQNLHHITLTGLPGPVSLSLGPLESSEDGQHSVTVSWRFSSSSTVEETTVTLRPLDPMGFADVQQVPIVTSRSPAKEGHHRLSPLRDDTTYMVRVVARNQYGPTAPAEIFFRIADGELTVTQAPPQLAESKRNGGETAGRLTLTPILLIAILSCFF